MKTIIYFNLLHHNVFNSIKSSKCCRYIVNKSSGSFFVIITENSGVVVVQESFIHDMEKQAQINYALLEEILLDLHYHIARLAWLIQEYLLLVIK